MSNNIAISCHKGGVGKTTTAASLGGLLALGGKKTLLVDLDPQMNLTTTFTDETFERTVYDVFAEYRGGRKGQVPDLPIHQIKDNLYLAPSSVQMFTVDVITAAEFDKANILRRVLAKVSEDFDFIFLDCPAQLGIVTANALVAADKVIIPMTCDAYSAGGLEQMNNFIDELAPFNDRVSILGVVVTKFRANRRVDREIVEALSQTWGGVVFNTRIRECVDLVKAPICKKDITSYDSKSRAAIDYFELLREIVGRLSL